MKKRVVTLGEILMRLTTNQNERFIQSKEYKVHFGGAEANVAISLANWGIETFHITSLPNNDIGKAAYNYIRQYGVNTAYTYFTEGRMGLYFLEQGAMQRSSKIIYDRFDSAFSNLDPSVFDWDQILDTVDWLHWTGITPAISAAAAQICLDALTIAEKKGITVSGDINYRRNLWQYGKSPLDIMPQLIDKTNVVIAGLVDFENCLNIKETRYLDACMAAQKAYKSIQFITSTTRKTVSSSHNELSGIMWHEGTLYESQAYEMKGIIDRIGGGDAFMAGLIYGLLYKQPQEALEFAIGSSVLKHSIPGDANQISVDEVIQLIDGKNIGRLLR